MCKTWCRWCIVTDFTTSKWKRCNNSRSRGINETRQSQKIFMNTKGTKKIDVGFGKWIEI